MVVDPGARTLLATDLRCSGSTRTGCFAGTLPGSLTSISGHTQDGCHLCGFPYESLVQPGMSLREDHHLPNVPLQSLSLGKLLLGDLDHGADVGAAPLALGLDDAVCLAVAVAAGMAVGQRLTLVLDLFVVGSQGPLRRLSFGLCGHVAEDDDVLVGTHPVGPIADLGLVRGHPGVGSFLLGAHPCEHVIDVVEALYAHFFTSFSMRSTLSPFSPQPAQTKRSPSSYWRTGLGL